MRAWLRLGALILGMLAVCAFSLFCNYACIDSLLELFR